MGRHRGTTGFLHGLGWLSLLLAGILAAAIIVQGQSYRRSFAEQVRDEHRLELRNAAENIENHFSDIWLSLRIVAMDPMIATLDASSWHFLVTIYETNYDRHRLSEIYVIEGDFDGTRRPFMTFERPSPGETLEQTHKLEAETAEYAAQMEQIRRFREKPALMRQITGPLPLCVHQPGIVCSVPVRSNGDLVAMVAGMAPVVDIAHVLELSSPGDHVVLARGASLLVTCPHGRSPVHQWLEQRLAQEGAAFFEAHPEGIETMDWVSLSAPTRILPDERWHVGVIYDAAEEKAGVIGAVVTNGIALLVLLLGIAVTLLASSTCPAMTGTRSKKRPPLAWTVFAWIWKTAQQSIRKPKHGKSLPRLCANWTLGHPSAASVSTALARASNMTIWQQRWLPVRIRSWCQR